MNTAKYLRHAGMLCAGTSFLAALLLVGCGGGGGTSSNGDMPTAAVRITGTAARGAPITSATVTIKDKNGKTATGTTDANGKYTIDVSGMTTPFLLQIPTSNGYLYSVATAAGTTNIHPYTDLIIKNWYQVQGSSVENEFSGSGALSHVPTTTEINTIEAVISSILSTNMSNAGVTSNFNLLTTAFDANSTGFDKVLDNTQVVIDTATGGVTVTATDATTGITGTVVSTIAPIVTTTDTSKPTDPAGLAALPASTTTVVLAWTESTDNIGVAGYNIYRDGSKIATSPYPVYTDTGRASGTSYCYKVEAFDGAGNISASRSNESCATPPAVADNTAPSTPTGLNATAVSASEIDLSWSASTDNVGVLGYAIYRGAAIVATVTGTSFSDVGLAAGTAYTYTVKAVDGALNKSSASASATATTDAGIPSAPTGIVASPISGQAWISWNSVSGATSYNLYWSTTSGVTKSNGTKITGVASPYAHSGRTNGTTYYYVVTAVNASGESVESAQASAKPVASISKNASGTYTWDSATGAMSLNWTNSTFDSVCTGPSLGAGTPETGMTVGATSMTWPSNGLTWSRSSGTAGNILGTWTNTTPAGNVFTLTYNADGTMSLSANVVACDSGSASTGGSPPLPSGPSSASGTYTWDAGTGTLSLTTATSSFVCSGPRTGVPALFTPGITISSTTMTWLAPDATTWTRASGTAGDIVGTWTATMQNGQPFALIFNANGTYSASGIDECARANAQTFVNGYYIDLQYMDSAHTATAVSVSGPNINDGIVPLIMTYHASSGTWGDSLNPSYNMPMGPAYPTGVPLTYIFTVTSASGTTTQSAIVSCFQQQFVSNLAPTGTASGAITFTWTGISDPGATYGVWMQDVNGTNLWSSYGLTGTSNNYGGPALVPGTTYNYSVQATGSGSTCGNGTSSVVGSFTYQ